MLLRSPTTVRVTVARCYFVVFFVVRSAIIYVAAISHILTIPSPSVSCQSVGAEPVRLCVTLLLLGGTLAEDRTITLSRCHSYARPSMDVDVGASLQKKLSVTVAVTVVWWLTDFVVIGSADFST